MTSPGSPRPNDGAMTENRIKDIAGTEPHDTISLSEARMLGQGYRRYERFSVARRGDDGESRFERDILRCGHVVGIVAVDPELDEIVLTRQFRLGAYLARREEATIEIPAGRVDGGETAEDAARRECREEIGLDPLRLLPVFELTPAPAWSDEFMTLFLARVDARQAPLRAGFTDDEDISVVRCKIDDGIGLVGRKTAHSAPTVIALQWLRLNRDSIATLLE
jgi:ADP-ribose pyrophosphatase